MGLRGGTWLLEAPQGGPPTKHRHLEGTQSPFPSHCSPGGPGALGKGRPCHLPPLKRSLWGPAPPDESAYRSLTTDREPAVLCRQVGPSRAFEGSREILQVIGLPEKLAAATCRKTSFLWHQSLAARSAF